MQLYVISLHTPSYYLKCLEGCTKPFRARRDKRARSTVVRTTSILKTHKPGAVHTVLPYYSHAALYGLNMIQVFQHIYTPLTSPPCLQTTRDILGSLRNTYTTSCFDDYLQKQNRPKQTCQQKERGDTHGE